MVNPTENTNNNSFIFGDFDKDGTKNIDDSYPFDKSRKKPAKEMELSDDLIQLQRIAKNNDEFNRKIVKIARAKGFLFSSRTKTPNSIIAKCIKEIKKHPDFIRDIGGVRVYAKSKEDAERVASEMIEELWRHGIEAERTENKFNTSKDSYYRAIHIDAKFNDKWSGGQDITHYVEIQVLTKTMERIAHKGHKKYKLGVMTPEINQSYIEEMERKNQY